MRVSISNKLAVGLSCRDASAATMPGVAVSIRSGGMFSLSPWWSVYVCLSCFSALYRFSLGDAGNDETLGRLR